LAEFGRRRPNIGQVIRQSDDAALAVSKLSSRTGRREFLRKCRNRWPAVAELREAAGHANASVMDVVVVDDDETVGNPFR
jgi:hypothetical protein